jgi:hypothetical protein
MIDPDTVYCFIEHFDKYLRIQPAHSILVNTKTCEQLPPKLQANIHGSLDIAKNVLDSLLLSVRGCKRNWHTLLTAKDILGQVKILRVSSVLGRS